MSTSAQNSQSTPATSPLLPHDVVTCHKHTLDAQAEMRRRYRPYRPRIIPPALELRFASKSIGDTSFSDLGFEDVVEGKHKFMRGLSHFSDSVVQKAYVAKMEFRNSILHRIMLCQANINATASRMDLFHAMEQEAQDHLKSADEEIKWVKEVMGVRGIDDLAFHHATYVDELVALTIADMQVEQMTNAVAVDGTDRASDRVDSDTDGSEEEDDLVYKDSQ
ncbi:hypothetical protein V8E55_005900 [Tylopilus felleus]